MLKNNCHKLLMVFCLLILFSAPGYAADPIQITTWEELDNVRNGLDLDYILMNDLDQTSDGYDTYVGVAGGWSPIGVFVPADIDGLRLGEWDADNSSTPFTGSFNGNGFTISDLIIDRYYEGTNVNDDPPSYDSFGQGLFGYLNDAEVYDLKILNASVSGFRHVGILAGYTRKSTLSDIETSGELYTRHNGGGLVGTIRENTLVQNCSSIADVEGDGVDGGSLRTGGLFGAVHTSTVQDCFTNGTVKGDAMDQGGLAGSIYGTIVGGDDYDKYDKNSYVGSLIIRCHASGTVSGRGAVGGLIGSTNQASVVEDCYTTGEVFATSQEVGGLIGNTNYFSHVIRSYSTSDVTGNGSWVGGLVGIVCNYSVVEQSFATGDVSNGRILTGGLVGHLSTGGVILDSYALGNILGLGGGVGGLVGSVEGVLLNDKTDPSDDEVLGATILRSYSIGSPAGPYSIGGLLGDIREGTVTSSYWDVETSGINDSLRGEGLTTDAMLQQSSYVGWDFGGIWDIEEGNSYPFLVWQGSNQIPYLPNLIAVNDSVEVQEDSVENLIDVLFNDIVLEGDPLEIAEVTVAANGTVVISDNAISYTPDLNYEGFDSFKYTVIGGNGESDSAVVFVRVNNENDPPEAVDDAAEVNWNTSDNVIDVLSNDSDIDDDDVLTVTAVSQGEYGTVGFTETEVTYTPNEAFYGVDSFTYTISDGNEGTDTATVTITVLNGNNPPVAADDTESVNEDSVNNTINVLANDTDSDGNTLVVTGVTEASNGTVTFTATTASYTPDANYTGTDSFTYTISDGNGGTDTATVTVTVTNVNDAPKANNDLATVNEDSVNNTINVLANDTDLDGDTLVVTGVTEASNGTVTFTASAASYTPDANYTGTDSFTYTISDGNGGTDTATVTVTVTNANDAPNATNDLATVNEDSVNNTINVLANDTDSDGDTLVITGVTEASNGTVTFTASAASYTPDANYAGTDSFTYTISDGNGGSDTATVTVTVTNVNDAPNATNDLATVNEDSVNNTINVLANDTDSDGDTLVVTGVTEASNGTVTFTAATASYTPDANYTGADSFTYTISDGNGGTDTATVTVTVTNVNDAPSATNDLATVNEDSVNNTINVLANDTDLDGDTLVVTDVTEASNGTVTFTASAASYTPDANYTGTDSFTYTISDGHGGTDTAIVNLTVKEKTSSGGSKGGSSVAVPAPEIVVTTGSNLQSTVNSAEISSVINNGSAIADISTDVMDALMDKAEGTGGNEKGDLIEVIVEVDGDIEGIEFNLQSTDLKELLMSSEASFKLSSPFISMTFDYDALKAIDAVNTQGEIVIAASAVMDNELSEADKLLVKDRPVYELTITKGGTKVTSFGEGHVTVVIPYEPKVGEDHEAIVLYYLSDQGVLQLVTGNYDEQLKSVIFETYHFSEFVIGYNPITFTDVKEQAWYKNAVDFVVARGITSGTGANRFEPETQLNRADFVVMLMNAYAPDLEKLSGNQQIGNFDDAGNTYYTDELLTAKRLGLINGTGQNLFEPELEITRQEMMVILHNMLKILGEVPTPFMNLQLSSFNDADQVADWAEVAIVTFVNSGIVVGYNYNLNPEDFMTRAEIAQILFNLLSK